MITKVISVRTAVLNKSKQKNDLHNNRININSEFLTLPLKNKKMATYNSQNLYNYFNYQKSNISFKGETEILPNAFIKNAKYAITQWEKLKHPLYSDITDNIISKGNKNLEKLDYSFLDELTNKEDKKEFINKFKEITGFPNLEVSSSKIIKEFKKSVSVASNFVNKFKSPNHSGDVIAAGYDCNSSVALKKALPGSDLNNGYVLIKGNHPYLSDKQLVKEYQKKLLSNIDNRILNVIRKNALPQVYTINQAEALTKKLDSLINIKSKTAMYFGGKRLCDTDAVVGSEYNRIIADNLPGKQEKKEAKDFAYFIETLRDGNFIIKPDYNSDESGKRLSEIMNNSRFCIFSNATQMTGIRRKHLFEHSVLPKIAKRTNIEKEFDKLDTDKQYDFVKNIIKSISSDENKNFKSYLISDNSRRNLANDILIGKYNVITDGKYEYISNGKFFEEYNNTDK